MTERCFVDTNVLVYIYDSAHPTKQATAAELMTRLWRERSGRTSAQVLNELYVTLTKKLPRRLRPDEAWDIVHALTTWDPQAIDSNLLLRAREIERRYRISWWDSLIVAAAQLQDCDVLLTEDLQSGMTFNRLTVVNPFNPEVQETRASYVIVPMLRHRPRGRPRKSPGPVVKAVRGP